MFRDRLCLLVYVPCNEEYSDRKIEHFCQTFEAPSLQLLLTANLQSHNDWHILVLPALYLGLSMALSVRLGTNRQHLKVTDRISASKRHIIPGAIMTGLIGCAGQSGYETFSEKKSDINSVDSRPLMERLSESKWMPLKSLSNEEYAQMLNDKLLRLEVEISMIDDKIANLQKANSSTAKEHT